MSAAIDQAVEEAIVRAFRSPALRHALERALNDRDPHEDIDPEELAWLVRSFLASRTATAVWAEVLESEPVQMLVERIADAPEVRAAITAQGAGLLGDVGVRLTRLTEALDDALERIVRRAEPDSERDQAGLATRALAAAIDLGLLFVLYTLGSAIVSSIFNATAGGSFPVWLAAVLTGLAALAGAAIIVIFWALVGQTPGMRFLAIRVIHEGSHELGLARANRRMLAILLALAPAGLGVLWIARDRDRRGWHDRLAGTEVVYVDVGGAPYSGRRGTTGTSRAHRPARRRDRA
ncbi:RDD family protein [Conexibacter sp. DBS9H8]|uniref:RDD family protein n=1 Tax=Conexibacter sp. DBS9H8 TaxID=2937801 RepID=UPI00200C8EDC|nr:RDD family protein [Conexibacter sp. DBS9H8]